MQDSIMRAMEQADNLISLGGELKTFGIDYSFYITEGAVPTHYTIEAGSTRWTICRKEYADDDAVIVNGMALESEQL